MSFGRMSIALALSFRKMQIFIICYLDIKILVYFNGVNFSNPPFSLGETKF